MGINANNVLRLLDQKQETRAERIARLVAEEKARQIRRATAASSDEDDDSGWFKAGAFEDGWQGGDLVKTILGTAADVGVNALKGAGSLVEGVTDLLGYAGAGIADLVGADEFASDWRESVQKNTVDAILKGAEDYVDQASVLGNRSDAISQGLGQVGAIILTGGAAAGLGTAGATAVTTAVTGLSGMGSGMSQAYQAGATDGEALAYGAIAGTAEAMTEFIFAGMGKSVKALGFSKGLSSADDILAKKLSSKISSQLGKNLVELGVKASAEGAEEWLSGVAQAFGKKLTYMSEKEIGVLIKGERLFDQFLTGAITSGIAQSGVVPGMKAGSFIEANQAGRDLITGLTQNEQAVVDKVFADRVAERKKSGTLSKKQETEIYDKVLEDIENGRISTDTIESVLGGEAYKGYQSKLEQETRLKEQQKALQAEIDALQDADNTIGNNRKLQNAEAELEKVTEQLNAIDVKGAKSSLFDQVDKLTAKDTKLRESYNERVRKGQAFEADLTKYDAKQQETVKKAVESGILNNSNRTHEFVDLIAKISADKGIPFDFANNAKLKESGFAIDGKQVNGFVTADGVTVNVNSAKALNSVVGHEITHVLEGTELYNELQSAIVEYAKSKGDYQGRYDTLAELYKDIDGANIDAELTADLVGDYLFTDIDFLKRLSTEHRNVFQKLFDEIKYLCKVATAGSKEAKELEKVKKLFEEAYRTETKNPTADGGTKYSIGNIVGASGKNYGIGVHLDSTLLSNLTEDERIDIVKEYVKELGGSVFTAYDGNGDAVDIHIVESSKKFKNKSGKRVSVNKDLTYRLKNEVKQEAIALVDELVQASSYHGKESATHPHDWLDDNGANDWDLWKTYIQDKQNTVWEASLRIANSTNGEKILYDIFPIKKVEGAGTAATTTTNNNIASPKGNVNGKFSLSETKDTAPVGEYRITGEDIALAPTKEDIARMEQERIATAQNAPRNDVEELGAPTSEDIARMEREKKLKGPLLMKDSLDRELEKLYRLQQLNQIQDNDYFVELSKVSEAYHAAGRDFSEAFGRVVGAYPGEIVGGDTAAMDEESTAVNTNPALHTPEEQAIIEEYQAAVDEDIRGVFEEHLNNPNAEFSRHNIGDVSERQARDAAQLLGGEYMGYKNAINTNGVKHILIEHGPNGTVDVSMADLNDPARIGYVLDNYDSVEITTYKSGEPDTSAEFRTKDNKPAPMLTYKKKVNGTYYVVEAVPESRYKKFWVVSAYMKADSGTQAPNAQNPGNTPNASLASSLSANNNMPQTFTGVKQKEVEAVIGKKDAYVSKQANALYDEVKNMQKGKRVSNTLSYLLDTLDLSEEHKAESYSSLKTALLNIRDNPSQVVNSNSAVESAAREMLGREYDGMVEEYANAEGVAKSIYTKMESLRTELENDQRAREQSNADFDSEIARLQAEYEVKKNKNTKVANDILRRMERTQRLKSQIDADYGKRIDRLGERLEKISKPEYKTAMQRKAKMEEYTNLMAELVGDTSTWVDKKLGLSYSTNTLRRNLRDIIRDANGNRDTAKADAIYDELQGKYNHNEAELKRESARIKAVFQKLNLNHAEDTYAHMLGEFQFNPESQLSQEQLEEFYEKHKSKIDTQKVDKAIAEARKVFDDLIVRVNERLKEQGMKQIPYRQGYFPHFTNPKQGLVAKFFNWKPVDNEIPTSIAGLTEEFNPQKSWQSFDKQRTSDSTDYSLEQGLDSYIHGALDWIYHIEDIQKRRALENHIRYVHSDEGIKKRIDEIRNNETYDADEAQELIDAVYAEAKNPLNNFVSDLRTGTNTLANKKSSFDRKAEEMTNRKIYSVMTNLNSRINANMVVGSFSSALTNFIPITQSWVEVSPAYSLKGMRDTIKSTIRDDGIVNKSDFLTNRLRNEEKLYQTGWDKVSEKAGLMMEAIDSFTSQTVWRSKYLQNIAEGMSENEAIKNADQFAENVIAGRSRGNQPTIFDAKNPLTKIFTAFQLEVANQYGYMFKDAPQDSKNKGRLIKGYATAFLGAYAYNALYSSLVGRDAAFDPISILEDLFRDLFGDDEEEPEDVLLHLADNVLEEVPFIGGLVGGGRVPISSAIPYEGDYKTFITDLANGELSAKEMLKPVYYLAMPVAGGQIKKTNEGLKMFDDDFPVAGSYTDSGNLRFPVEDTVGNRVQAAVFGQYASENAREYFDNGWAPLKEKQIEEFASLGIPVADYREIRKQLGKLENMADKFDYIDSLDLTVEQKNILVNNVVDRKEPVDMTGYDLYEDFDEFDFYIKNQEKYQFLKDNGIAYKTYNASEESREAYNWAYQNPEKYQVSLAVTEDTVAYKGYAKDLSAIKADKDSKGNTVSGSRKKKVVQYLNGLDATYGAKIILYKMEYPSDDTYNGKIIEYVNGIEGFSYEQKESVLKELGFTVSKDGKVSWN